MATSTAIALGSLLSGIETTIANGQTESAAVKCLGMVPVLISTPASFTGTSITFLVSPTEGGTYSTLYGSDGNAISMTVASSRTYAINPANFEGIMYLKVKSGSAETGAKILTLSLKGK